MMGEEDDKYVKHKRIHRQCPLPSHAMSCIANTVWKINSSIGNVEKLLVLAFFLLASIGSAVVEVPVREFWGQDTILLDPADSVTLQWFIQPANATVDWIRCYIGEAATVSQHFFTYIHSSRLHWAETNFASVLLHSLQYGIHTPIVFSLIFMNPDKDLSGAYTCELEGCGLSDPILASLRLRVFLRERNHTVSKVHSLTTANYGTEPPSSFASDNNDKTTAMNLDRLSERCRVDIWIIFICISSIVAFLIGSGFGVAWNKLSKRGSGYRTVITAEL